MSTIDGGYAIIYANCSPQDANTSRLLAVRCTLNADFISYNETSPDRTAILYEVNRQNITFNGVYCDLVSVGVGQSLSDSSSAEITVAVPVLIAIVILYFISYDNIKCFDKLFEFLGLESEDLRKTIMQMIHTFSGYAIIVINLLLTVYFVFISTKEKPELIWPRPSNENMEEMDKVISKELNEMINILFKKLQEKITNIIDNVSGEISKQINEICNKIKDISRRIHEKIDGEKIHEIISNISNDYRRISYIMPKLSKSGNSVDIESKDSELGFTIDVQNSENTADIGFQLTKDMQKAIIAKVRDEVLI
ncbi:20294_t:CDS:2, partial [Gigaspora rosea]